MLLHCPPSAYQPSIFPRENEGIKHLSEFEFLFPLPWHLYVIVTGTGLEEQPSGSLTGGHPYAAVMFFAN